MKTNPVKRMQQNRVATATTVRDLRVDEAEAKTVKAGAVNAFANFRDIKGEAGSAAGEKDWIEVLSYSHGV